MLDLKVLALQANVALRAMIQNTELPDEVKMQFPDIYPKWESNQPYIAGQTLNHGKNKDGETLLYTVIMNHASQEDWLPEIATSLYKVIGFTDSGIPIWTQPLGYDDAYEIGDIVEHNEKLWVCEQGNASGSNGLKNTYTPGVWGWVEK